MVILLSIIVILESVAIFYFWGEYINHKLEAKILRLEAETYKTEKALEFMQSERYDTIRSEMLALGFNFGMREAFCQKLGGKNVDYRNRVS